MSLHSVGLENIDTTKVINDKLILNSSRFNCGHRGTTSKQSGSSDEEDLLGFEEIDKQMFPVQKLKGMPYYPKNKYLIKQDPMGKSFLEFNSKLVIIDKWPKKTNPIKQEIKEETIDIEDEPLVLEEAPKPQLITVRKGLMKSPVKLVKTSTPEASSSGIVNKVLKKEVNIVKKTLNVIPVEGSKHSFKVLPNFDPKKNLVFLSKDQFNKEVANKNMVCKKEGNDNIVVLKKTPQETANVLEIYTKLKNSFMSEQAVKDVKEAESIEDTPEAEMLKKKYCIQELLCENTSLAKQTRNMMKLQHTLKNELEMKKKDFEQLQEDLKFATASLCKAKNELFNKEEDIKQLKETIKNMNEKMNVNSATKTSVEVQTDSLKIINEATQTDFPTICSNDKFMEIIPPETESFQLHPQMAKAVPQIPISIQPAQFPAPNLIDFINDDKRKTIPIVDDAESNCSFTDFIKYDQKIIGNNVNMGNGPKMNYSVQNLYTIPNPNEIWGRLGEEKRKKLTTILCNKFCDQQINDGNCPIHIAVKSNDLAGVRRQCIALQGKQVSVDIENIEGLTPLHLAILHHSDPEIVLELIQRGADFSTTDRDGNNAFHLSALNSYLPILEEHSIISKIDLESINNYNYDGSTPLILCGIENKFKEAEILIKYKADVNMQDKKSGRTALFHAVESDALETVRVLLDNGANKWIRNFMGLNAQEVSVELDKVNRTIRNLLNSTERCGNVGKVTKKRPKVSNEKLETVSKRVKM